MLNIYGASWCVPCRNSKKLLDRKGVEYNYFDVEEDADAMARIQSFGYNGVPVFELDGEHWQGFNKEKLDSLQS